MQREKGERTCNLFHSNTNLKQKIKRCIFTKVQHVEFSEDWWDPWTSRLTVKFTPRRLQSEFKQTTHCQLINWLISPALSSLDRPGDFTLPTPSQCCRHSASWLPSLLLPAAVIASMLCYSRIYVSSMYRVVKLKYCFIEVWRRPARPYGCLRPL